MPILVAYQFKHERDRILSYFKGSRVLDKNPQTIRDWNAGKIPMLLAHPASCGHGLSMQDGGNILVFYSTGWNLDRRRRGIRAPSSSTTSSQKTLWTKPSRKELPPSAVSSTCSWKGEKHETARTDDRKASAYICRVRP